MSTGGWDQPDGSPCTKLPRSATYCIRESVNHWMKLQKASFVRRGCVNPTSCLLQAIGQSFTQPLREKYALNSQFSFSRYLPPPPTLPQNLSNRRWMMKSWASNELLANSLNQQRTDRTRSNGRSNLKTQRRKKADHDGFAFDEDWRKIWRRRCMLLLMSPRPIPLEERERRWKSWFPVKIRLKSGYS